MGLPQQPYLLNAQHAQQLFDPSASALSAASGSSLSASSSLSALASVSSSAQLSYSPLQLQAVAAAGGMWPHLSSFLPVQLNLAQHMQHQQQQPAYGAAQPLAHQQQQQQQHQHQQMHSAALSSSALSSSSAPSVFPLPPAPLLPVAHPAVPSVGTPQHTQSHPPLSSLSAGDGEKRRRGEGEEGRSSKKRSKSNRRLTSAPSAPSSSSTSPSPALSPSTTQTSISPPTSVHSIFSSPHHSAGSLLQPVAAAAAKSQPASSAPLSSSHFTPSTAVMPVPNNALLQLSNLTLSGSLAALANGASTLQPAPHGPITLSPSARYAQPGLAAATHSHSAGSPTRSSTSRVDQDSISRTSSNDSGTDSEEEEGESSSKRKTRKKHIVTDRQRRAKIKEGMTHLRGLLLEHGSFTTDQVSIMMASVQLIHQLKDERLRSNGLVVRVSRRSSGWRHNERNEEQQRSTASGVTHNYTKTTRTHAHTHTLFAHAPFVASCNRYGW